MGKIRSRLWLFCCAVLVAKGLCLVPGVWAQSCDDFDECTTGAMCQPDGTCKGTPRPDTTSCNDGNPCTSNDRCQSGRCQGFPNPAANGTSCADLFGGVFGSCLVSATCQFGACLPALKTCPPSDNNNCTYDICNPANGQCTVVTNSCQEACSSGQCDPASGECLQNQPTNNGGACDDLNECTSNDRCNNGTCRGSGGGVGPTFTPTRTATPPQAESTATPSVTATTTEVPSWGCLGDCNGDGRVTIGELVRAVRGALAQESVACGLDRDANGAITVDEIVAATSQMCVQTPTATVASSTATVTSTMPAAVTPSPTLTRTATVLTPTATGLGPSVTPLPPSPTPSRTVTTANGATVASRSVGTIHSATTVLLVIPDLLSGLLGHLPSASLQRSRLFTVPFACPGGGGGSLACDQDLPPPVFSAPVYTVQLNDCKASGSGGASLRLNGALTYTGSEGEVCGSVPENGTLFVSNLTIEESAAAGTTTATFTNLSASVELSGNDEACRYSSVDLTATGGLAVSTKNAQGAQITATQATFSSTRLELFVSQYGQECVPEIYTMFVNGLIALTTVGNSFEGTFNGFTLANDTTSGSNLVVVEGEVSSACLGGNTLLRTRSLLSIVPGSACPRSGEQWVDHGADLSTTDLIRYQPSSIEIDYGYDESVDVSFDSCLDPRLLVCPTG